jgi:hypothetical protein
MMGLLELGRLAAGGTELRAGEESERDGRVRMVEWWRKVRRSKGGGMRSR